MGLFINDVTSKGGGSPKGDITLKADWELAPAVKNKFFVPLDQWTSWSDEKKKDHFTKFCNYQHNKDAPKTVTDKDNLIKVSKTAGQVKKKENQTTRIRSTRTRNTPKWKAEVVQSLDNDFLNQLKAKIPKKS